MTPDRNASRSPGRPLKPHQEERIEAIAEKYLEDLRSGSAPDRDRIVRSHPEMSPWLERRLLLVEALLKASQPEHNT